MFAASNPFFLSTNEIPMKKPDATANETPTALNLGVVSLRPCRARGVVLTLEAYPRPRRSRRLSWQSDGGRGRPGKQRVGGQSPENKSEKMRDCSQVGGCFKAGSKGEDGMREDGTREGGREEGREEG